MKKSQNGLVVGRTPDKNHQIVSSLPDRDPDILTDDSMTESAQWDQFSENSSMKKIT